MTRLGIAVTLPGESALGTFEAGALSALLIAVQAINKERPAEVDVDVMTGASSGALTAVIAAAALLTGCDPVAPLRRAWVTEPTLDSLRGADVRTPLSLEKARSVGNAVLSSMLAPGQGVAGEMRQERRLRAQRSSVQLEFALTCLRGFTYEIRRRDGRVMMATSHLDWAQETLTSADVGGGGLTRKWSLLVDAAIASASLPVMFPPALLTRSRETYTRRDPGITNLPSDPISLWYADGGLVNREPLGQCIRTARERDTALAGAVRPEKRLVLAIRPCPDEAPAASDTAWTGEGSPPRWRSTVGHALRALVTHSIYEDLCGVESTNDQLAAAEELRKALTPPDASDASVLTKPVLVTAVRNIRLARAGSDRRETDEEMDGQLNSMSERDLIEEMLGAATGLGSKRPIEVEIVAPFQDAEVSGAAVSFVSERLRATDFLVGYESMLRWMHDGLQKHGVRPKDAKVGIDAARTQAATIPGWVGSFPIGRRPPLRLSAKLLRLGARTARAGLTNPRAG